MLANPCEVCRSETGALSGAKVSLKYLAAIFLLIFLPISLTSCIGISQSGNKTPTANISISPTGATLTSKATQQFSATVQNTSNSSVTWTATAGTVSNGGLFTAPLATSRMTVTITATSVSDSTLQATAVATVNPPGSLTIVASALPPATAGKSYSASLLAVSGIPPYVWDIAAGALPEGFQLNQATGGISGTTSAAGSFSFQAGVSDTSGQHAVQSFVLLVNPASASGVSIVTSSLPPATAGESYTASLSATGGVLPYTWSIDSGSLPAGIQLDSSSGVLAGTATTTGNSSFQVVVTDATGQNSSGTLSLTVNARAGSPVIPASFFGMHVAVSDTSLEIPAPWGTPILSPISIGAMGKCVTSDWSYIEQSTGNYNWSKIDTCTNWAAHFGIQYFQSAQYMTPASIGASNPATDSRCWPAAISGVYFCQGTMTTAGEQEWINFNTEMAARYKGNPGLDFYEGWNEPPFPGNSTASPLTAAQLASYEIERVTAIHTGDPDAKVASPAFIIDSGYPTYATFMDTFLGQNPPSYDYYDFHINYPNEPEDEIPMIAQYKQILANHGIVSPIIYATEAGRGGSGSGASTDTCPSWPANVTLDLQEAFIARMELLYWSQGISRHYWYAYDTCGTLTNQPATNTLNSAGIAYGIVENWMVGSNMSQTCTGPAYPAEGVWTCGLTKSDGTLTLAVWDSSQSCGTAGCTTSPYTYDPSFTKYYTLAGASGPLSGGTVQIGAKPILLSP